METRDKDMGMSDEQADLLTLRQSIMLLHALKNERTFREVYFLRDSHEIFQTKYPYLLTSHLNYFRDFDLVLPFSRTQSRYEKKVLRKLKPLEEAAEQ